MTQDDYGSRRRPALVESSGTYSYPAVNTEQTVFDDTTPGYRRIQGALDFTNYTAARVITIRIKEEIDGTNLRTVDELDYTVGTDPMAKFDFHTRRDARVTMQIDIAEAGATNTPWYRTAEVK